MECFYCGSSVIWCGDHDYEDYGLDGEGIVSNMTCSNSGGCGADYIIYLGDKNVKSKQTKRK